MEDKLRIIKAMRFVKAILLSIAVAAMLDVLADVLIPDHVMNLVYVVTMSILLVGILLVAFGTVTKNGWGINLDPVSCPACGSLMPKVRRPKSLKQALGAAAPARSAAAKWTNGAA
jgi:hypothetical protein